MGGFVEMWQVTLGVKGASRTTVVIFKTKKEADERAERWRRSNSIGSYWAKVKKI